MGVFGTHQNLAKEPDNKDWQVESARGLRSIIRDLEEREKNLLSHSRPDTTQDRKEQEEAFEPLSIQKTRTRIMTKAKVKPGCYTCK